MLQLLSPWTLVALATLVVPAILHLWRPPAKTVRVGTLRYFTGSTTRRLNKLRWRELLLLALRLLLLALLVFLLAQPFWKKKPSEGAQKWALLESGLVLNSEAQERWRALKRAGYETRQLAPGFARLARDSQLPANTENIDVWSLLREADARLPAGSRLAVLASGKLTSFRGERPRMRNCEVEWVQEAALNEARAWIQAIRAPAARQLHVTIGRSDARATESIPVTIPASAGKTTLPKPLDAWSVEVDEQTGTFRARLFNGKETSPWTTAIASTPLRVAILSDLARAEDARYVEAALRAVAEVSGKAATFDPDVQQADWIFWLNDQPPSTEVLQVVRERGVSLLVDAEKSSTSFPSTSNWFLNERVPLYRRTPPPADGGATIWSDSFGMPLLTVREEGRGRLWRFGSRFHPSWNDLPRSSALPAALRPILATNESSAAADHAEDVRIADPSQAQPADARKINGRANARLLLEPESVDLHNAVWLLCALLFVAERVLSHRTINPSPRTNSAASEVKQEEEVLV